MTGTKQARFKSATLCLALLPQLFAPVAAIGDYPCSSTSECASYAGEYPLSTNATCVADPLQPEFGYCGFAGAPCGSPDDCDFGTCTNGACSGYIGSACSNDSECLAYFFCGIDGLCGGTNAQCLTGNAGCLSHSCSEPMGSNRTGSCAPPPLPGMPLGSACSLNSNCGSDMCDPSSFLCVREMIVAPSQAARARTKREQDPTYNPKDKRGGLSSWFGGQSGCSATQTACPTVGGFECIDTMSTLESCGGCPEYYDGEGSGRTKKAGMDCTTLPFVDEVYCRSGRCKIVSCLSGTRLSDDGTSCIMR